MDLFLARVESVKPTVIILTETWLKPAIPNSFINIPGYDVYRDDRIDKRSGGVAIYITNAIPYMASRKNVHFNNKYDNVEYLWVDFEVQKHKILLCGVYRSHDSTLEEDNKFLHDLELATQTDTVVIMGDFNFRGIKWPLQNCGYLTPKEVNFVQWYSNSNLYQMIDKPTRFRQGNQPSSLDLILTNDESLIASVDYEAPIGKSDHSCLISKIQLEIKEHNQAQTKLWKNFSKVDYNKINEEINPGLVTSIENLNCPKKNSLKPCMRP